MARLEPLGGSPAVVTTDPYQELEIDALPRDHPKWVRDAAGVSQRARALLARIKPLTVRVLGFWDHHVRSIAIGRHALSVDASGSYCLDRLYQSI